MRAKGCYNFFLCVLFFVICLKYLFLQIITLCNIIVIQLATEAMLYPCCIHVHIFMMSLLIHVLFLMPCQLQTACRELYMSDQVTKKADSLVKDCLNEE